MNPIKLFKMGKRYMQVCPKDKRLTSSFPEIRIINYLKLASRYLPPIIVGLIVWQYTMNANIILTSITVIFTLSLPLQGYLWLGKRATTPLPLNLLDWYNKTRLELIEKQVIAAKAEKKEILNFFDFMQLLALANLHLDNEY